MGKNIRSSSSPQALATSFPMPPLADAMDAVRPQRGSVLSPGRGRGLGRDDGGGRHDRVRGPDIVAMGTVGVIAGAILRARSATTAAA